MARPASRNTHPWAWWGWALLTAAAVTLTRNPLLLLLVLAGVAFVVLARRSDAPWARSVGAYFVLALVIVAIRVAMQIIFGGQRTGLTLFTLPEWQLPDWAAGIRLGGPVTLNGVLSAFYDGLRLATIIICIGAANALANPRKALKSVPAALHELSVAVVIALALAPQLVESLHRVRRSRRLRGGTDRGWRAVGSLLVPVLEDAVERSLQLAAGMEARGYGRTRDQGRVGRAVTAMLLLAVMAVTLGVLLLLGIPGARWPGLALLLVGMVSVVLGLRASGRRLAVTRYRPDPWTWRETMVVAAAGAAAVLALVLQITRPSLMAPTTTPLVWPALSPAFLLITAAVISPVLVTPTPARSSR